MFGLELYLLHVPSVSDDRSLEKVFAALPPRCIVLLGDIDAVGIKRRPGRSDDSDEENDDGDSDSEEERRVMDAVKEKARKAAEKRRKKRRENKNRVLARAAKHANSGFDSDAELEVLERRVKKEKEKRQSQAQKEDKPQGASCEAAQKTDGQKEASVEVLTNGHTESSNHVKEKGPREGTEHVQVTPKESSDDAKVHNSDSIAYQQSENTSQSELPSSPKKLLNGDEFAET